MSEIRSGDLHSGGYTSADLSAAYESGQAAERKRIRQAAEDFWHNQAHASTDPHYVPKWFADLLGGD